MPASPSPPRAVPTVTWTSPPGARSFEVFLSNQTELTSKFYRVANLTPLLDSSGGPVDESLPLVLTIVLASIPVALPAVFTLENYQVAYSSVETLHLFLNSAQFAARNVPGAPGPINGKAGGTGAG